MTCRLAVNMLVLNGESVLRRCLLPLKGIIDELVVVDSGSTDNTQHVLEELATEMKLARFYYETMHPFSQDFITDEPDTWQLSFPSYSGRRLLKDWAAARNRALDCTHADYILKLDADDEPISSPENWLRTVACLDAMPDVSIIAAPYEIRNTEKSTSWISMYDRMWRRVPVSGDPPLRWTMTIHEYLLGKTTKNTLYTAQGLRVCDWRDSPGAGVRVDHRNLKTLLWDHENNHHSKDDPNLEIVRLFTLAHEAADVFPELAIGLLEIVAFRLEKTDVGILSDCHYHRARAMEALGHIGAAILLYEEADQISLHVQALLREYAMVVRAGELEGLTHRAAAASPRLCKLREKIFAKVGTDPLGSVPLNCDLGLLAKVRADCG
jgi:hypothetical protein